MSITIRQSETRWAVVSVIVAAALRLYLAYHVDTINSDGILYIDAARHFYRGAWRDGLANFYPPGFPLAIAAMYPLFRDWEVAGTAVSLVTGMLIFVPLIGLLRRCEVRGLAFSATVLGFALCPYPARYASIVRSEALYGLVFMVAVWALASYLVNQRRAFFVVAGVAAGVSFNIRPEGIGLLIAGGAAVALAFRDAGRGLRASVSPAAMLAGIAFAFVLPYVVYLKIDTGQWMISRKTSHLMSLAIHEATGEGTVVAIPESDREEVFAVVAQRWRPYVRKLMVDSVRTFIVFAENLYYAYVPFLLIGIVVARNRYPRVNWLLHCVVWFYVLLFVILMVNRRNYTSLAPVAMVWCGTGFAWLWAWLVQRGRQRVAVVLALVTLATILGKALRIPRTDHYSRPFGSEIARLTHGGAVVARVPQVAFYAGGRRREGEFPIDAAQLSRWLEGPETWLVVTDGDLTADAEAVLNSSPAARLMSTVIEKNGKQARLYRLGRKVTESSASDRGPLDPSIP